MTILRVLEFDWCERHVLCRVCIGNLRPLMPVWIPMEIVYVNPMEVRL